VMNWYPLSGVVVTLGVKYGLAFDIAITP
jgi:hypothetical protein